MRGEIAPTRAWGRKMMMQYVMALLVVNVVGGRTPLEQDVTPAGDGTSSGVLRNVLTNTRDAHWPRLCRAASLSRVVAAVGPRRPLQ